MKEKFNVYALEYLRDWKQNDSVYCKAFQSENPLERKNILSPAMAHYDIQRNFPVKYENGRDRYEIVHKILENTSREDFEKACIPSLYKLINEFENAYKQHNMSAATKLTWLKYKKPIIIYDSRVRKFLGTNDKDLSNYYRVWKEEYKYYFKDIQNGIENMYDFLIDSGNLSDDQMQETNSVIFEDWFAERVFDKMGWTEGT